MSVCRVKASSGVGEALLNRGGTVEFMLHPQCKCIEDEVYFFSKTIEVLLITFLSRKVMPARRGQYIKDVDIEISDENIASRGFTP